ncbi:MULTISPECIES: agmatine deiminase family protein [unclassified Helicobacter]|uniref:agmatine deiminase family protein n=1 Tax=unclassified Helicobacter TaxID=2593540 RepID=UPI000CF0CAB8|nr:MULTISPECIES: agmatine deiminase family protein [unclassified Helicobacter]
MKRLKAEWEKQEAILMAFPHQNTDWKPYINEARENFLNIIKVILQEQKVILCLDPSDQEGKDFINTHLKHPNLILTQCLLNDTWARDFGPISIEEDKQIKLLDFGFNGWGLKFASNYDNQISNHLLKQKIIPNLSTKDLILEGGSIDTDGKGTLLTNTQCLLEKNRNPALTKAEIEKKIKEYLGIDKILWLNHGFLEGDDTDSHIDTLARFLNPDTIAYIQCNDKKDIHYEALQKMQEELRNLRNKDNKAYKLVPLPLPCIHHLDERLPASYANFLIINNNKLLLPIYGDKDLDTMAIQALSDYYEVIPIECSTLIKQHGSLHCVTMQIYELL